MLLSFLELLGHGINPINLRPLPSNSVVFTDEGQRVLELLYNELASIAQSDANKRTRTFTEKHANALKKKNLANGRPARSNFPWSEQDLSQLEHLHNEGMTIGEIAAECERSKLAVAIQLEKLCLVSIEEVEALR